MFKFSAEDMGIDLGTSNVIITTESTGVTIREPSVVAIDKDSNKILDVGSGARNMLGRTPGSIATMSPIQDGIVSDYGMTVALLQTLISSTSKKKIFKPKPRVVISVPSGVTEVEERTVINAALEAGARRVFLIEAPLAAALGANLDIKNNRGNMVVDIGGGCTDIATLTKNSVSTSASINLAGSTFDDTIVRYVRHQYGVVIGQVTAESVKIEIGSVVDRPEELTKTVRGREVKTGVPRAVTLTSSEISHIFSRPASAIADKILYVLESTQPEIVGDIALNGITLTGGGSQLYGLDMMLSQRIGIPCTVADEPASCVAYGCGKSLSWISQMSEGPINLARNRAKKEQ